MGWAYSSIGDLTYNQLVTDLYYNWFFYNKDFHNSTKCRSEQTTLWTKVKAPFHLPMTSLTEKKKETFVRTEVNNDSEVSCQSLMQKAFFNNDPRLNLIKCKVFIFSFCLFFPSISLEKTLVLGGRRTGDLALHCLRLYHWAMVPPPPSLKVPGFF